MGRKKIECLSEQEAVDGKRVMNLMVEDQNGSRDFCGRRFAFSALSEVSASSRSSRSTDVLEGTYPFVFLSHVPLTTAEIFLFYIMYLTFVV